MVVWFASAFDELFYNLRRSRNVRIADSEVNQIDPAGQSCAFPAIDFCEKVRRQLADSIGFLYCDAQLRNLPLKSPSIYLFFSILTTTRKRFYFGRFAVNLIWSNGDHH